MIRIMVVLVASQEAVNRMRGQEFQEHSLHLMLGGQGQIDPDQALHMEKGCAAPLACSAHLSRRCHG